MMSGLATFKEHICRQRLGSVGLQRALERIVLFFFLMDFTFSEFSLTFKILWPIFVTAKGNFDSKDKATNLRKATLWK